MLEDTIERFPLTDETAQRHGGTVRPVKARDETRVYEFLLAVPEEERLFIKRPLFDRAVVREWCRYPDYGRNLVLLVLRDKEVIGEATLHQRTGGWKRHIGLINLLTHPEYRGLDVSKILVSELIEIAETLRSAPAGGGSEWRTKNRLEACCRNWVSAN